MATPTYTVLIVPERSAKVRRLRIPRRILMHSAIGALTLVALAGFLGINYLRIVHEAGQNRALKKDNIMLKERLRVVQDELARVDDTLQRINKFSDKVRAITRLNDPERKLAIGPLAGGPTTTMPQVMYAQDERIDFEDETVDSSLALRLIDAKVDEVASESQKQESSMRELHEHFATDQTQLNAAPSIRPITSKLMNSTFGVRKDPYTGQRVMHKGVDYAADLGSDVVATADGTIIFAGNRGKYGKTIVVDHGFGLQTHFAHLSEFKVEVGQGVRRGQVIGAAGNTGLTTGVHLHYEVRYNGIPQDPEHYILD